MSDKEEYMKKLDDIQRDINWIVRYLLHQNQPIQSPPYIPNDFKVQTTCAKCGMNFEGVTGYYCSQLDCPTFTKTTL